MQVHKLAKNYHWTIEYIDEVPFEFALKLLCIIKKEDAEALLSQAQTTSLGTNGNEDAWDDFIESLGYPNPKFADLKEALDIELTKEDLDKQMAIARKQMGM